MPIASSLTPVGLRDILLNLILALYSLPASCLLLSKGANKNPFSDSLRLNLVVNANNFNIGQFLPLLDAILSNASNKVIWDKVYYCCRLRTSLSHPSLIRPIIYYLLLVDTLGI
jgi:hypothetical protein